jgi:NAD(P)-dependent dehydrogenase (short-subunit alcohol dehydrogenase family)
VRKVTRWRLASMMQWLCSPGASYMVGHALTVDDGIAVL